MLSPCLSLRIALQNAVMQALLAVPGFRRHLEAKECKRFLHEASCNGKLERFPVLTEVHRIVEDFARKRRHSSTARLQVSFVHHSSAALFLPIICTTYMHILHEPILSNLADVALYL